MAHAAVRILATVVLEYDFPEMDEGDVVKKPRVQPVGHVAHVTFVNFVAGEGKLSAVCGFLLVSASVVFGVDIRVDRDKLCVRGLLFTAI